MVILMSSIIGIATNSTVLAIWFMQMSSRVAGGAMSSAKN
jgi:hypothetical protein